MISLQGQEVYFLLEDLIIDEEVIELDQDENGIIWMLADDRLISYNGYEKNEFLCNEVDSMEFSTFKLSSGKAIIGSHQGDILIFNCETKTWKKYPELFIGAPISKIDRIDEENVLIGAYGTGLFSLTMKDAFELKSHSSTEFIYDFVRIEDQIFISSDQGVYRVDYRERYEPELIHEGIVTHISTRGHEELWFIDYDLGLVELHLNDHSKTIISLGNIGNVKDLSVSEHNELIGTNQGLFKVNHVGILNKWTDKERQIQNVNQIFIDDENDLWIYDQHSGFWKGAINFKSFSSGLNEEVQTILCKDNKLMLGTEDGLYMGEIDNWNPQLKIKDINVTSGLKYDDYCFIGTYNNGVFVLDSKNELVKQINSSNGLADKAILKIAQVDTNRIEISTLAGVQQLFLTDKPVEAWNLKTPVNGLSLNYVLDIFSDDKGSIYYGLDKSGFKVKDRDQMKSFNKSLKGLDLGSIYSIAQSTNGTIWMSSENLGIVKFRNDTVFDWTSPHGHDPTCYSIISIANNQLVFVGEESIDVYDITNHELLEYDNEIGLKKHTNFLNNYYKDENQLWMSHGNNIYIYEQSEYKSRTRVNTVIDKIEVNLGEVDLKQQSFAQDENNFTFYYSGILHRNTKRIYYSYQLLGFDEVWRSTQDRFVSYPHLEPGEYEFRIKASHDEFSQPSDYKSYSFEIRRSFYNSFWFWSLILLFTITLIYYWIQRTRKERALKIELDQKRIETQLINLKSQLNPHFMFNSFNTMIGLIEEDKERGIEFIEHLTDFYRGVLEIGEDELIDVEMELDLLKHYIHLLKERFGDGIHVNFVSDISSFRVPPLALQMLIENAVKHNAVGDNSPLIIDIYVENGYLVVNNNKQLKTQTGTSFGIGLENLRRRYAILAGKEIIVESTENNFSVKLPVILS